jgi:hypothetical protein
MKRLICKSSLEDITDYFPITVTCDIVCTSVYYFDSKKGDSNRGECVYSTFEVNGLPKQQTIKTTFPETDTPLDQEIKYTIMDVLPCRPKDIHPYHEYIYAECAAKARTNEIRTMEILQEPKGTGEIREYKAWVMFDIYINGKKLPEAAIKKLFNF